MRVFNWPHGLIRIALLVVIATAPGLTPPYKMGAQNTWQNRAASHPSSILPAASTFFAGDLWVDAARGNDDNDGRSAAAAFRTIQQAADLAEQGATVHIQPGVYRESIVPAFSGSAGQPIQYVAEGGPGTAIIRGSEPSSSLYWTQLQSNTIGLAEGVNPANIYYADLSVWGLKNSPRFIVELDDAGEVAARLPLAREPDWPVVTDWKYHEYWWAADGGAEPARCYPPTDENPLECDAPSRSLTELTDRHPDSEPDGIEPGDLTTLGSLTGARLIVKDNATGTFIYLRRIIAHDVKAGRITVDQKCEQGFGTDRPALGWGSKYYVEDLPGLLDTPGEWWYDPQSSRLYLWPRQPGNPAAMPIEISRWDDGFTLRDRSYLTLDGITIEFFNNNGIYARNTSYDKSHQIIIRNANLRYADIGVWLSQYVDPKASADMSIDGFVLENSEISFMDNKALHIYSTWYGDSSAAAFIRPGILNTVIRDNELHHLGFNTDSDGIGAMIVFPDRIRFERNYVHHVAHNGVQFIRSVVKSTKTYSFTPDEIKTGDILIRDNIFEKACQNATDCGALKISGTPPDRQVFRNLLVTGNIFRDTFGWTYIAEKRGHFSGGPRSVAQGLGGFGFYVDNASGVYAYRNITYNNAFAGFKLSGAWRDGEIIYYNNTITDSLYGFHFGGKQYDTHHGSVNTHLVNNILVNHEEFAIFLSDADGVFENTTIDHNLYENNGWRSYQQGGEWKPGEIRLDVPGADIFYQTLQDIKTGSNWEVHGVQGNPVFWRYDFNDHDLFDSSWPDLRLTSASANAIDRGVTELPDGLSALLNVFNLADPPVGSAYDIGRFEAQNFQPAARWWLTQLSLNRSIE